LAFVMPAVSLAPKLSPTARPEGSARTAYLILDTETIPDGELLAAVKYPGKTPDEAIELAQKDALAANGSDFLPVVFQLPVAACVLRVGADFHLQSFALLDAPEYRPATIAAKFWQGMRIYPQAKLVTFNGRRFDLPLLELAAFRHGLAAKEYLATGRHRYGGAIDLFDWLSNFGAAKLNGGLDLLAKLVGKPGKMEFDGSQVWPMYRHGRIAEINQYCLCDTLDTYFVFLRTRVMTGELDRAGEAAAIRNARLLLERRKGDYPMLKQYLDAWK
jgi:predicted PolB exonuclease-like 3'-5' exonuclease